MRLVMAIDASKCMNCRACVLACQQRNNVPLGHARNWVRPVAGGRFQPGACMHCDNPPCVAACPTAATFKADDGSVAVDKARCIGCGACATACPYEARYVNRQTGVVDKCDYCAEGRGQGREPACVAICATKARVFGDIDDAGSDVAHALAAARELHFVKPASFDPKPALTYLGPLADRDWPTQRPGGPVSAMPVVALAVRWLGGLSLFGVVAVFLKQLVLPSGSPQHGGQAHKENDTGGKA